MSQYNRCEVRDIDSFVEKRGEIFSIHKEYPSDAIKFTEDKASVSREGVLRGFHGDGETWKLVTCLYGRVYMVVYGLFTEEKIELVLSSKSRQSILIPPYYLNAHLCLSDECIFHYKQSEHYKGTGAQWAVRYDDPDIGATWPTKPLTLSDRDQEGGSLRNLLQELKKSQAVT